MAVAAAAVLLSTGWAGAQAPDEDLPQGTLDLEPGKRTVKYGTTVRDTGIEVRINVTHAVSGAPSRTGISRSQISGAAIGRDEKGRDVYVSEGDGRRYELRVPSLGTFKLGQLHTVLNEHPGQLPRALWVDGEFSAIVWVPMSNEPIAAPASVVATSPDPAPAEPAVDPRALAEEVLREIGLPDGELRANPSLGLVAVPSWFWLDGVGTQTGSASLGGTTVEVQLTPERYRWSFGDGSGLETDSPGRAYPQPSDVSHTYEAASHVAGGTFATSVEVTFRAQYSVNGGPDEDLGTLSREYAADYAVQQTQAVLGRRSP